MKFSSKSWTRAWTFRVFKNTELTFIAENTERHEWVKFQNTENTELLQKFLLLKDSGIISEKHKIGCWNSPLSSGKPFFKDGLFLFLLFWFENTMQWYHYNAQCNDTQNTANTIKSFERFIKMAVDGGNWFLLEFFWKSWKVSF